jgi:predicted enzyme related to lactoylglutathione lyase
MPVRSQPLIAVADVQAASAFYQRVLGATSGHGGTEYERITVDGELVLQLHDQATDHHHGLLAEPGVPVGSGVLIWFAVDDFDGAVSRVRELGATIDVDEHVNPNAQQREIWLRDIDGYRVVLAEARAS